MFTSPVNHLNFINHLISSGFTFEILLFATLNTKQTQLPQNHQLYTLFWLHSD